MLTLLKPSAPNTPPASEPEEDEDNLPPGEILERLADLKQRGLLEPDVLQAVREAAEEQGLKLGF